MQNRKPFEHLLKLGVVCLLLLSYSAMAQEKKQLVRQAIIQVDTSQLGPYNELLREEIEASIRLEPGVITLYAVSERETPTHVTIFETYADSSTYRAHLLTPHFLKYKNGTLPMVRHLQLIESEPLLYIRKPELAKKSTEALFIRLIKIEIDSSEMANFRSLVQVVMFPGIQEEPGTLMVYAVSQKNNPTQVSILEVYADAAAYETHLQTPHYLKFQSASQRMTKSVRMIDVTPIYLGSKPQRSSSND